MTGPAMSTNAQHTPVRYYIDANIQVRVHFTDDGENDLTDQAHDAVKLAYSLDADIEDHGVELLGKVTPA